MTDRELMQQALEALDWAADCIEPRKPHNCDCPVCVASDALRERLAQSDPGCAECGKSGGWALYCVACAEKLIAAAEREACARVCENMTLEWEDQPAIAQAELATLMDCALAIRSRSNP